jgi:hypothetical protein
VIFNSQCSRSANIPSPAPETAWQPVIAVIVECEDVECDRPNMSLLRSPMPKNCGLRTVRPTIVNLDCSLNHLDGLEVLKGANFMGRLI